MVATRGPVPQRSEERRRRNNEDGQLEVDQVAIEGEVPVPPAAEHWHDIARQWYESLSESGQRVFYEPSDWASAFVLAETLSRELKPQFVSYIDKETGETLGEWHTMPIKGASLTAILKGFTMLMVTESDRRRMRMEIERRGTVELPDDVPDISERRAGRFQ